MSTLLLCLTAWSCLTSAATINLDAVHTRRQSSFTPGSPVNTTGGTVQGRASPLRDQVSEYLGIPFAQPPVGDLRFEKPVAASASSSTINATAFGPDCAANLIPTGEAYIGGPAGSKILIAEAQAGDTLSEDCLTVNVWTKPQSGEQKKAVLFWIYGGGFSTGNTACPIYDGAVLADEQDVVVVSANYRLNIFGFSAAPGEPTNVGLLDQRLALEWARDNVEAFGGDPARITVFGQSAGGASTDFIAYGYPDDPIAQALIPQSGVANSFFASANTYEATQNNYYEVSEILGCGGVEAGEATVPCVKSKPWKDVTDAIAQISPNALMSGFSPVPDGEIVPYDIPTRGTAGDFAHLPYLTGSTSNEAGFFLLVEIAYTNLTDAEVSLIPTQLFQPLLDTFTLAAFTCPAATAARYRSSQGIPVWRYYYYGGNYTNTYIDHIGANYHTSELPIVFGTAESVTGIPDSDYEAAAAKYMRSVWAAFAKDPTNGLSTDFDWPMYDPLTISEAQLSYGQQTSATFVANAETDALCPVVEGATDVVELVTGILSALPMLLAGSGSNSTDAQILQELEDAVAAPRGTVATFTAFLQTLRGIAAEIGGV